MPEGTLKRRVPRNKKIKKRERTLACRDAVHCASNTNPHPITVNWEKTQFESKTKGKKEKSPWPQWEDEEKNKHWALCQSAEKIK